MIFNLFRLSKYLCFLFAILLVACNNQPKFDGFKEFAPNGFYRLQALGEESSLKNSKLIYVDILVTDSAKPATDTLINAYNRTFTIAGDPLSNLLIKQNKGDSLTVLFADKNLFLPQKVDTALLTYQIKILNSLSNSEFNDAEKTERRTLTNFFKSDSVAKTYKEVDGIFIKTLTKGDSTRLKFGNEITLNWEGRDFNNRIFDTTDRMSGPFKFVYGNSGQVLEGIEIALRNMHLNEVTEVIIPSRLAFGSKGSVGNHVPPFTPVIYTLKVEAVE